MKFGHVLIAYFLIGGLMWAGGVIDWQDSGVPQLVAEPTENGAAVNESTQKTVEGTGGPIQEAAQAVGVSGLFAIWELIAKLLAYLFWPITALQVVNAPTEVVVVAGGGMVVSFIAGFILLIRSGA